MKSIGIAYGYGAAMEPLAAPLESEVIISAN